jgi:hypothetical protein
MLLCLNDRDAKVKDLHHLSLNNGNLNHLLASTHRTFSIGSRIPYNQSSKLPKFESVFFANH